ncbi:hypothetical protein CDEST_03911 [Colletotrichum destructivum]|uniref:Uncharacterized protein n=1 Tax=Colletotrichum destructivum TaxID=34406 RepID=A0AAX4I679_9PEZI|nr:hypothetical protein CDEST_03911 [Colletotrichum destructivum]
MPLTPRSCSPKAKASAEVLFFLSLRLLLPLTNHLGGAASLWTLGQCFLLSLTQACVYVLWGFLCVTTACDRPCHLEEHHTTPHHTTPRLKTGLWTEADSRFRKTQRSQDPPCRSASACTVCLCVLCFAVLCCALLCFAALCCARAAFSDFRGCLL